MPWHSRELLSHNPSDTTHYDIVSGGLKQTLSYEIEIPDSQILKKLIGPWKMSS